MDPKTLELLEFRKIQEVLAREADTDFGRKRAMEALPTSTSLAREEQKLGRELMDVLSEHASPGLSGATDIGPRVSAASQGVVLQPVDLRRIVDTMLVMESLSRWLDGVSGAYPELSRLRSKIPSLPGLRSRLYETVDVDGQVKDSASPALQRIRRALGDFRDRMRKRAEELVRRRDISQYLQEPIVSIRDGRYVLPVRQEHAAKIGGLVHDQSASGQTLFVEPPELLEMANQMKRLELEERDEIDRILTEVSAMVGDSKDLLHDGCRALSDFDFALAKVRLAFRWKGCFPALTGEHVLKLSEAYHPLLTGKPVPMDISLSRDDIRTVVITGPNMGGKTVALKTCGLLTVMALSGFPCPCREDTVIGEITGVLAIIGDEQSIEENLSTFSAHISNVVRILKEAGPGKLVLVDELGAGTDPQEGAALALAILKRLNDSGALSVVTSHFSELKIAAQETQGMRNASVEWDAVNMIPTYRLVIGRPGRSNAFLVAKRLGMPEDVLRDARANIHENLLHLDDVIQDMEESAQKSREAARDAEIDREKAARLRAEWEEKVRALEASRKEILNRARREAASMVNRARLELEKTIKEFRDRERESRAGYSQAVREARERLRSVRDEFGYEEDEGAQEGKRVLPGEAVPGKEVAVKGFKEPGIVLEPPDDSGSVAVRIGPLTMRAKLEDLRHIVRGETRPPASEGAPAGESRALVSLEKTREVSFEIDLRGMTGEEAANALDKYLDDALLAGLSKVRIIHGKGTGALRKAVSDFLRADPRVSEWRLGETGEGGSGVTVAKVKI
jgi:DNA mismatch repair protein MutS2